LGLASCLLLGFVFLLAETQKKETQKKETKKQGRGKEKQKNRGREKGNKITQKQGA
jgi:hypothetical protein